MILYDPDTSTSPYVALVAPVGDAEYCCAVGLSQAGDAWVCGRAVRHEGPHVADDLDGVIRLVWEVA